MTLPVAVGAVAATMALVMAALWRRSLARGEADVVDLGWTLGLGASAVPFALALDAGVLGRRWLVAVMVGTWSARLGLHLVRRVREPGEDGRYRRLRAKWGDAASRRFFVFFQAQGALVALLSIHFALAMTASEHALGVRDALAVVVWLAALGGEWIADRQLGAFRADPANRGAVCRTGLWRYSRHPNYFFEWLFWLSFLPMTWGAAVFPVMLIAPGILLLSILFVTGIPPTEAQAIRSRGEAYIAYQRTTSAFVPWFPKRGPG